MKTVCLLVAVGMLAGAGARGAELSAQWIWGARESYRGYNDTIVARKVFKLPEVKEASLAITADTAYRLFINGAWVNDGPCRSWPEHYQYDVIDVREFLKAGENEIRVIAKYYGVGTFHQIPQQAGLLVQLDVVGVGGEAVRVVSDGSWQVREAKGWVRNTVKRCIQMGPYEIYDAREEELGIRNEELGMGNETGAAATVLYGAYEGPWKGLNPRDCPLLTRRAFGVKALVGASVVERGWRCYAFPSARLLYPELIEANGKVSMASAVATVLEVPEALELHVAAPGCTVTIDGKPGKEGAFVLDKGAHFLLMVVTSYFGHWQKDTTLRLVETEGYTLRNPRDANVEDPWCFVAFEEAKYVNSDVGFALLPREEREAVDGRIKAVVNRYVAEVKDSHSLLRVAGNQVRTLDSRTEVMEDPHAQFEARQVLGDARGLVQNAEGSLAAGGEPTVIGPSAAGDVELLFDLGEQNVGYYHFDVEAEAGTVLDIAEVEYIAPDGRVQFTTPYRNSMRYVCKAGRNGFTSLERRSGRFIFLTVRRGAGGHGLTRTDTDPHGPTQIDTGEGGGRLGNAGGEAGAGGEEGAVKLHLFELIESTYPVEAVGRFACSDPKLDKIWEISARTLKLCMEDTFTDCPLYEQTHWVGDARKEALFGFTAFGAGDLAKRCIRLTGLSLEEDYPITLSQTPSCWGTLIPAWSFLWGMSVWDYYEYSGDEAFLREVWPMVMQNLRGTEQFITDHGLFSGPFWNFFDWSGIDDSHRTVLHNSMLLVGAIDAARKCAAVVQDAEASHSLAARRAALVAAINALYDQGRGGYPDSIHEDRTLSEQRSVHNNFLALLYDIAPVEWRAQLRQNVLDPPEGMVRVGSPGALFYQHLALEQFGQQDAIIASIYENYQPMLDAGATTVWESFASGTTGSGGFPTRSHCHAWSSGPIHFLNRIVLGILPEGVGGTSFVISPRPSGLAWAKGATASVRGPVEVEWTLEGKTLTIAARAPAGVKLAFKGNAAIAGNAVVFNGEMVN